MGVAFSDIQVAFDSGLDYFFQEEENIYIVPVEYPSGVEYHLRKQDDLICEDRCIKKYILNEDHKFRTLDKALKAVDYFRKKGKRLMVKKSTIVESGYTFINYYYLCST